MFRVPQEGDIRVVIELRRRFLSPPNDDWVSGTETYAHCRAQILRPRRERPEWSARPVEGAHTPRHFAVTREEPIERRGGKKFTHRAFLRCNDVRVLIAPLHSSRCAHCQQESAHWSRLTARRPSGILAWSVADVS